MLKKFRIPLGVLLISIAFALFLSGLLASRLGGSITQLALMLFGTFVIGYKKDDVPFSVSVRRGFALNREMLTFLGLFYILMAIATLRVVNEITWDEVGFILKIHFLNIVSVVFGLFFFANPRYTKAAIYLSSLVLFHGAVSLNNFVDVTGEGARLALSEANGALGSSGNWQAFGMQTFLLLGLLMDEKNKIVKGVGLIALLYFYKSVLLCGFATPVGLFLLGHGILGFVFFFLKKKTRYSVFLTVIIPLIFLIGMTIAFITISQLEEDSRYRDVQVRFRNMMADPRGGGYEVEDSRFQWIAFSIDSFKKSPIWGVGGIYPSETTTNSGHYAFFDYLALYGVFGCVYTVFLLICFRNSLRRYQQEQTWLAAASVGVIGMYILGGVFNPCWMGVPMTVMLFYAQPFKRGLKMERFPGEDVLPH